MVDLTHLSLFSGIGGIDLAAEWAGFKTIGQIEIEDYPIAILNKHWPEVPKWRDIYEISGKDIVSRIGQPTLISAGFPCQPHSCAGKHQASCDERDLTGELKRIIRQIKPRWFLAENVAGLRSSESGRFFGKLLYDISEMGYTIGWGSWEAADVGAPHHRERIFIVAHLCSERLQGLRSEYELSQTVREVQTVRKDCNAPNSHDPTTPRQREDSRSLYPLSKSGGSNSDSWKKSWIEVATRLCRVDDGIPSRVDRLKCLGNAVVPAQVYPILKVIADYEREINL